MDPLNNRYTVDHSLDATVPHAELRSDVEADISPVASMSVTNILFLPRAFYDAVRSFIQAIHNFDREAFFESAARMFNIPFGLAYALEKLSMLLFAFLEATLVILTMTASIAGCVFVLFEIILECTRLYYLNHLRDELNLAPLLPSIRLLKNSDPDTVTMHRKEVTLLVQKLEMIRENHFRIATADEERLCKGQPPERHAEILQNALKGKLNSLARKISKRLVTEISININSVIENIPTSSDAIQRGVEIIEEIDTQIHKARKVYIVGLLALSIAVLAFAISSFLAPYLLPLVIVIGVVGTVLEFGRWFAPASYLEEKGETWNWDPWLPECLKKKAPKPHLGQNSGQPMLELVNLRT